MSKPRLGTGAGIRALQKYVERLNRAATLDGVWSRSMPQDGSGQMPAATENANNQAELHREHLIRHIMSSGRDLSGQSPREQILAMVSEQQSGFVFTGASVALLRGPCVYLWLRGDRAMYVGMGTSASRPFSARHHIRKQFRDTDEMYLWPMASVESARVLEGALIRQLKPQYNRNTGRNHAAAGILGVSVRRLSVYPGA